MISSQDPVEALRGTVILQQFALIMHCVVCVTVVKTQVFCL